MVLAGADDRLHQIGAFPHDARHRVAQGPHTGSGQRGNVHDVSRLFFAGPSQSIRQNESPFRIGVVFIFVETVAAQ